MRIGIIAAGIALVSASPVLAQSTTTASTEGTFTQAFTGPGQTRPVYTGIGTNDFSFGLGTPSTFFFAGANGDFVTPYDPPNPFFLGSFFYFNGRTTVGTDISAVILSLNTTLSAPVNPAGDGVGTLDQLIYITNTTNSDDPDASADFITFNSLGLGGYVYEGATAIFNLYGTINSPLTISDIVLVSDRSTGFVAPAPLNTTPLALAGAVPEPATWAMMIGGFGIVGGAMRRQRKVKTTVSFA